MSNIPQLYPDQQECVRKIFNAFRKSKKVLFVLPTGGGKTFIACDVIKKLTTITPKNKKAKRVYFLAHRKNILNQLEISLETFEIEHGKVQSGKTQLNHFNVQVCGVQTLINRLKSLPTPDLILVDEAHHSVAGSWLKVINFWPNSRILGVTATPRRRDGRGLGEVFDELVVGDTMSNLIQKGRLSDFDYYVPGKGIDFSGINISMGDYNLKQTAEVMDKPKITGDAIEHYLRICPKAPAIAFCVSIQHAENVAEQFRASGVNAIAIHSKMSQTEIDNIIEGLGNGSYEVVTSCDLISEGTDIPVVKCAILLRPTHSESLFLQQVGRALRMYEGKGNAIILDHVNNIAIHGLPDKEREWSLTSPKTAIRKGQVKLAPDDYVTCPNCFKVDIRKPKCANCGYEFSESGRKIETVNGNLVLLTREEREFNEHLDHLSIWSFNNIKLFVNTSIECFENIRLEEERQKELKFKKKMKVWNCKTKEDFIEVAKELNYKRGWAHMKWNAYRIKHNLDENGLSLSEPIGSSADSVEADDLAYQCGLF